FLSHPGHGIGRPRLAVTTQANPAILDGGHASESVLATLALLAKEPATQLSEAQRTGLLRWYRTLDPDLQRLNDPVEKHARRAPQPAKMKALICSEGLPPLRLHTQGADFFPESYFLKRGDPNQKEGVATQSFLQVLMRNDDGEKHWLKTPPTG